jgi:predicted DNA binding CopG/RHH family protein
MKKKLPKLHSDAEAEEFVADADLTEYDLSEFRPVLFEFQPKSERVNMRVNPHRTGTPPVSETNL